MAKLKLDFSNIDKVSVGKRPEILLSGQIPKPLHGMSPRVLLGKDWWDKKRRIVYAKGGYKCASCGIRGRMEAHEIYKIDYDKHYANIIDIVSLCNKCHMFIHIGFAQATMPSHKVKKIYNRGLNILDKAGLLMQYQKGLEDIIQKNKNIPSDWSDWYIEIEGLKFYTKLKNIKDWRRMYGHS